MNKDVTFVIPIFDLKEDRINNLKFILPYILKTGYPTILIEQTAGQESPIKQLVKEIADQSNNVNFEHVLYVHSNPLIHKTGMINSVAFSKIKTKYVWVNDVDFYMRFESVLNVEWTDKFIQPYDFAKKLNKEESDGIRRGQNMRIDFSDEDAEYLSLYGALSFIFEREAFIRLKGMDESLFGWAKEDEEFYYRLITNKMPIKKMKERGIHLWHPIVKNSSNQNLTIKKSKNTKDMAVITCHFNWGGFINPIRNLHRFIRQMQIDNIPLFGVELSLTDKFETSGIEGWKQIKVEKENVFFQKEACLNLAEKMVPKEFTKIAWIDCDLMFTNKNWYNDASKKLDKYKVVQLYSRGIKTDRYGRQTKSSPSAICSYLSVPEHIRHEWVLHANDIGYPGGAMAARRELWNYGGLYPFRIMGGGDTAFLLAMVKPKFGWESNELFVERHNNWKKKVMKYVAGSVSYIDGEFIHEWHGDTINRKYVDRYANFKKLNTVYIKLNPDGLVHNYGDRTINQKALEYFQSRNEDGNPEDATEKPPTTVVYTCIIGEYDNLKEVPQPEKDIEYICFSDKPIESKTWKIRPVPNFLKIFEPAKIARCIKILPHLFLSEYSTSLWVDGSIEVLGGVKEFIEQNLKDYFAISKHPDRICVYQEAEAVIRLNKDIPEIVNAQIEEYRRNGYPQNSGMIQSGIIIRNHNDKRCIMLCELWWKEVKKHSKRDQLSFNYCIWNKNVTIDVLNPSIFVSKNFQIWKHTHRGGERVALRSDYGEMKNYMNGVEV